MSRSLFIASAVAALIASASIASADTAAAPSTTTPANTMTAAPATPAETTQASNEASMDEVVCKKMQVTGQLLPGPKVCRTRGQWLDMQRLAQQQVERGQGNYGTHASK